MARKRTLGRRLLWGVLGYVVTTFGTLATTYLTSLDISPLLGSSLATGVGLVVVVVGVLIDHAQDSGETAPDLSRPSPSAPHSPPYPQPQDPRYAPTTRPQARRSVAAVLLVVLLLCGVGGWGVAYGAQWVGQQVLTPPWERKTQDEGVERLAHVATRTEGVLTVTVTSVRVNDEVTMVTLTAENAGSETLRLPVFGYSQLTVPGANTLSPDPAASTWVPDVASGGETTGMIVFDGVLDSNVTGITLTFTQIFGGFGGPKSIAVDIPIAPAA